MSADLRPGAEALESPKPVTGASEVASHWKAIGSAIGQTQAAQHSSVPAESWTGAAADAASAEIQALGGKLSGLSGQFATPASALTTWEARNSQGIKTVEGLQTQWDDAIAAYKKTISEINARAATDKEYNPASDLQAAESTLASAQAPLKKSYDDEIHQLSDAANTAATEIQKTSNDTIPADVVKGGRAAVGAELFGKDMPIADGAAEWDYARTKAPQLRDDLEKAANSDKPLTEAEVKKLQEKWGDKLQNPYWVQALADSYRDKHGKDANFSDMLNRLTVNAAGSSNLPAGEGETRNSFVNSIGNAMVLATGGSDASKDGIATSAEYAQVKAGLRGHDGKTTIEQIEHANIESFKSTGDKVYDRQRGDSSLDGYQIFTQATGFAGVKNPDLTFGKGVYEGGADSLAGKIVEYDQKHPSMNAMNPGAGVDLASIVHSTDADDKAWKLSHDPLQSLFQLSDTPDSIANGSAPSVLQNAEGTRLMHLRDFLNSNTSFDVDLPEGRKDGKITFARYLAGNRHADDVDLLGNIDGGEALGDMLNDASNPKTADVPEPPASDKTAHKIWENDRLTRAAIAANTMAGYQDGLDYSHSAILSDPDHIKGEDVFGHKNWALRSWMGSIISPYVDDLASEMHNSTGEGSMEASSAPGEGHSGHMQFGRDIVTRFKQEGGLLQDLAFDQPELESDGGTKKNLLDDTYKRGRMPALQAVQVAAYTGYMGDVYDGLQNPDYHVRMQKIQGANSRWTELIHETFDANADQSTAIGKALDASNRRARQIVDFIVDKGTDYAASQVPAGGALAEKAAQAAAGKALDHFFPTDNELKGWQSHSKMEAKSHDLMQNGLIRAMYDSDHWTENAGTVDVSPGTQAFADKDLPFVNSDGTRDSYDSLSKVQRDSVRQYFRGKNSDFRPLLDGQYDAQQNAQNDGRAEKPSGGGN